MPVVISIIFVCVSVIFFIVAFFCLEGAVVTENTMGFSRLKIPTGWKKFIGYLGFVIGMVAALICLILSGI